MRLFIGVELDDPLRASVRRVLERLRPVSPDSKWIAPQKAHLTLVFLGSVDPSLVPRLDAVVGAAVASHAALSLQFRGGGSFGGRSRPRVLWSGVQGEVPALQAVQADVARAVAGLSLPVEERPYSPHLTLARARHPRGDAGLGACVPLLEGEDLGVLPVREVVLFQSHTSNQGSRYEALRRWPLSRGG